MARSNGYIFNCTCCGIFVGTTHKTTNHSMLESTYLDALHSNDSNVLMFELSYCVMDTNFLVHSSGIVLSVHVCVCRCI